MGRHSQSGGDRLGCFDGLRLNKAHGGRGQAGGRHFMGDPAPASRITSTGLPNQPLKGGKRAIYFGRSSPPAPRRRRGPQRERSYALLAPKIINTEGCIEARPPWCWWRMRNTSIEKTAPGVVLRPLRVARTRGLSSPNDDFDDFSRARVDEHDVLVPHEIFEWATADHHHHIRRQRVESDGCW